MPPDRNPPRSGGFHTVSEANYAKSNDPLTGLARTNPTWPTDTTNPNAAADATANSDNFLENLGGITLRRWSSINHMQNGTMAHFDNHDAGLQHD